MKGSMYLTTQSQEIAVRTESFPPKTQPEKHIFISGREQMYFIDVHARKGL